MNDKALTAVALIALLAFSPQVLAAGQAGQASPSTTPRTNDGTFIDHGIELMNSEDRVTLSWLSSQTNGVLTVPAFENVIQSSLLPLGVRQVLLDIGWQNYAVGAIQEEPWVSNWLTASDALGLQNLLYLGQLTQGGYDSTWAESLIAADPSTQTYFADGTAARFVSVDNPDVAKAIEVDLQTLYSYYGGHPSWVGLGTGYPRSDPYFPTNATMPIMGYSNATLQAFANSPFFARDINQTGSNGNGTGDLLSSSFDQVEPSQLMTSGVWMTSSGEPVYGNQTAGNRVAMKFFLPKNESEIQLSWYGDQVGQAGGLVAQLVPDDNGTLVVADAIATASQDSSKITTTTGWQAGVAFTGNFTSGNYWVVFSSPSSDSADYVTVYMRDYQVGNYVSYFEQGVDKVIGYTVLRITDGQGTDLEVYPYQNEYIPSGAQTFVASQSFSFNTVFLFLSDRDYSPVNGTLIVTDLTDGTVEATGVLSQALTHGLQNWTPIQLDKIVSTVAGDNYSISIVEPQNGYSWSVVLRGVTTDPPTAGFQGQAASWLFRLDLMTWGQPHLSYSVITSNGADSVRSGHPDAIEFMPGQNETLEYTGLLMRNAGTSNSTYSAGSLTLGIWTSTANGSQPSRQVASINITASKVPENGWLNSSALHVSLAGGDYYWLVISTYSNSDFVLARLTSPYQSDVKVSDDGGRTWVVPEEGPSEYSFSLILSKETLGPAVSDVPQVLLSPTTEFGQPIQVTTATQVKGVYLGVFERQRSTTPPNDHILVSIHPDNGAGKPSETSLASGVYYGDNITFFSPDYISFTSVARLDPGQTYWIVVQPVGGNYYVFPDVYLAKAPTTTPNVMISNDAGFTWQRYSNQTAALSYILASPVQPSPTYNTTQLYQDLEQLHNFPVDTTPLKGWPAYVQSSELTLVDDVASWMDQQTGRSWEVAASAQPSVFDAANYTAITPLPANSPFATCADSEQYLLTQAPLTNTQLYDVGNLQLLDSCTSFSMASLAQILGYLQFYPGGGTSQNASNTIWQTGGGSGQYADLYYSISGRTGGPVVLWVSNAGQTTAKFSFSLNATQFGLRNDWVVLGLTDSTVTTGSGTSITIQREIPADSWYPMIVGSFNGTFVASYSDATIQRQLQYPNQGLYSTGSPENQSVILLISSTSPVGTVSVDSKTNLTSMAASSFYSSHEGWYYDATSGILLAKYQSSGNDTVRVLSASPAAVHLSLPPTIELAVVVAALFTIDAALVLYAAFAGRGRAAKTNAADKARGP